MTHEERRTPFPPPAGFHWEPGARKLTSMWATFWLVEDGRKINDVGFYEDYERGDGLTPKWPMPWWSVQVEKPPLTRRRTRTLVRKYEAEQARQRTLAALRAEYRPD